MNFPAWARPFVNYVEQLAAGAEIELPVLGRRNPVSPADPVPKVAAEFPHGEPTEGLNDMGDAVHTLEVNVIGLAKGLASVFATAAANNPSIAQQGNQVSNDLKALASSTEAAIPSLATTLVDGLMTSAGIGALTPEANLILPVVIQLLEAKIGATPVAGS